MFTSPLVEEEIERQVGADAYGRAFLTLRAMMRVGPGPQRLGAITRSAGLGRSTVHRILQSGVEVGMIRQEGRGVYQVTQDTGTPVPQIAISEPTWNALQLLHEATGDLVTLHAVWFVGAPHQACLAVIDGGRPALMGLTGVRDPRTHGPSSLLLGAAGHAMLAHLPPRLSARVMASPPEEPHGSLWREPLVDAPEQIVGRGYARCTSPEGWDTLAVPLLTAGTVTGAVSLTYSSNDESAYRSRAMHLQATADLLQVLLDDSVRVSPAGNVRPAVSAR